MISSKNGINTLACSITNIIPFGFWMLIEDNEYFISFSDYPAFKDKTISQILDFNFISPNQLTWKTLDIDIEIDALKNPQQYPLQYKPS